MFKQLSYFHCLEGDLSALVQQTQRLTETLADTYSPPEQVHCTVQNQIDSIIEEEQQLQSTLASIDLQVTSGSFVPERLDPLQLQQIETFGTLGPSWLPVVLDEQYTSRRPQLTRYAQQLFQTHQLDQKRKALCVERQQLMTLQARSIEQGMKGFEGIDLLQEAAHLKERLQHVRKSYQYYCTQIARKIFQFVRQIIAKSKTFHQGNSKPLQTDIELSPYQFRRQPKPSRERYPFQVQHQKVGIMGKYQTKYIEPNNFFETQWVSAKMPAHCLLPPHDDSRKGNPQSPMSQSYQHFYLKSRNMRSPSPQPFLGVANTNKMTQQQQQPRWISPSPSPECHNHHYPEGNSSRVHQHTCSASNQNMVKRVRSAQEKLVGSPRSRMFDYRAVLQSDYYS